MPRWTGRLVLCMAVGVVAVGMGSRTLVSGAGATTRPAPIDAAKSTGTERGEGTPSTQDFQSLAAFESLRTGTTDANIPPEALRLVAWQNGVPLAQLGQETTPGEDEFEDEFAEYDPWEGFNRMMFAFNQKVDRFVLKPIAKVWDFVVPDLAQQSLSNAFDNIAMPRRVINNLLQLKIEGAGLELGRFFVNISMGVGGFFDVATELGIPRSDEDTGQTLGRYGLGPGPYLVLPFLPPLTVRDGIGFAADTAMQPLSYVAPTDASIGMRGGQIINDRALNLESFEEFERQTFDLYSAVRNAYLQRRQRLIQE